MTPADWSPAKRARVEAAARPRRLIFNDDAHDLALDDADTPEGFLGHRLVPLAATPVDAISWSVLCGQFDAPCYDSQVQPIYGDAHGGPMSYWPKVTKNVKALTRHHRCPLHLVSDFAHAHGMEAFASVRMNDVHDSFLDPNGTTVWKRTNPQWMVDTRAMLPQAELYTTALDFTHEPVRRRKLEIIEEISQRYDVDGFELDYMRHPVLFSRSMRGEPCTAAEVEIITALMRQIRRITEAAAQQRGRPLLIATRTPDSFALGLDHGMDVEAWLREDLVDILIAGGGYAPFSLPLAPWVEAAHPRGVPVYPCINQAAAAGMAEGAFRESVRGLASNWYGSGAKGLYFWNLGTPFEFMRGAELVARRQRQYACLDEVDEAQKLQALEKVYAADRHCGGAHAYYSQISSPWPLPLSSKSLTIRTGVIGRVPLNIGDDVEGNPPTRVALTLAFDDPAWRDALFFRLNGRDLPTGRFAPRDTGADAHLYYPVAPAFLKNGLNFVEIAARQGDLPAAVVNITALYLKVQYD